MSPSQGLRCPVGVYNADMASFIAALIAAIFSLLGIQHHASPVLVSSIGAQMPKQGLSSQRSSTAPNALPIPSTTLPISSTSSMQTYTNTQFGFIIQYPSNLTMTTSPDPQHDYNYDPVDHDKVDYNPAFLPLVDFSRGSGRDPTTAIGIVAGLEIAVATSSKVLCLTAPKSNGSDLLDYSSPSTTTIDDVFFLTFDAMLDSGKVGLSGQSFGGRYFRTVHRGICYSIEISDSGGGFDPAPEVDKLTAESEAVEFGLPINAWDAFNQLTSMAQSFHFTSRP